MTVQHVTQQKIVQMLQLVQHVHVFQDFLILVMPNAQHAMNPGLSLF